MAKIFVLALWAAIAAAWIELPRFPGPVEASAVYTGQPEFLGDPATPAIGDPEATAVLVAFFDYNGVHCREMEAVIRRAAEADSGLRVLYKEFPILGPGSWFAATAALAAHRQGKYFAFHTAMMKAEGNINGPSVLRIAAEAGLDLGRLTADMTDPAIEAALERNLQLARKLGVMQTPTIIVGDRMLRWATDLQTLQSTIRETRMRVAYR